jgi:hypothetical protein
MSELLVGLLGIASSIVAESISWLAKKFQGTPFQGYASFIVAALIAFVGGAVKVYLTGGTTSIWTDFAQVFAVSEVYFNLVASTLGLTVSSTSTTVVPVSQTPVPPTA